MTVAETTLRVMRAEIDTYRHPVAYMHKDCPVCLSEGFAALARVRIDIGTRSIVATLNVVTDGVWLPPDAVALSEAAWSALMPAPGLRARFSHPEPPSSASAIRAKVYGERLGVSQFRSIIRDALDQRFSDLELAAFVTACAGDRLDIAETIALTHAMRDAGDSLTWGDALVLDKHCVGGLPGNRTTPIVVAIVASAGYLIPKTSSRAITSPAGTADTMEVMAPVALDKAAMRRVVETEGGCIVWGGGLNISPADDLLIRIERPLDFDSEGQLVASILSKKVAAGTKRVLIDLPVGPTAKVRSSAAAAALGQRLEAVGREIGLGLALHVSDGTAPVGRGIGPALEAADVLAVLRRATGAPLDLRDRALDLSGALLELAGFGDAGTCRAEAIRLLDCGAAEAKFMAICAAQGGFREPPLAPYRHVVAASCQGRIAAIDNRRIARIAKLAGAPQRKTVGVWLAVHVGEVAAAGAPLYEIHAESPGELAYALDYALAGEPAIELEADR